MVAQTVDAFGTVDILVNNAQGFGTADKPRASTIPTPMEDTDDAEWEYTFRTGADRDVVGHAGGVPRHEGPRWPHHQLLLRVGNGGLPRQHAYNATKEAIRALTRTAAREWGKYGISVNTVNPSLRTDAWENWEANNSEFVQGLKDKMPLGFLGDPEEHGAPWIVWLAGKGGEYVTGMTIMLNGGRHMP